MILGVNTAMRALKSVEAMDKLGPAYLMARENAAEKENTLRMGLMLVFMDVLVGCIICFWAGVGNFDLNYYGNAVVLFGVGFGEKCDRFFPTLQG
ncbi:MAG: hypothetical protein JGK17_11260 [Microcoleus sp. PH2017_10_PVI_O_A]|uniref:hypothetical protein n=1 Tax=unclassified Microcoleus TaxID=2642155 RepID=UPI001DF47036|nr:MULTISPECIES: hypothetical protein [unclassified Microcoleus]MCC3406148.1 hypothetical protein [Microcoleus sp. PH2017_10_PVI_O_A]MCC3460556.1 hypothetical protein [Microcoleus sp. PH2017_11_PCY_U_A]MCC3479049.1 hypothetical protein [Microcoleus sp. PH2017_12_PCY_D_A]MCC3529442.1 hypothetical protein [Microcoleus sp. PH2017_21_RUC_O_A]MCC3541271.1 hypothetical protein [Microcoleus sp. PH2017_22_RUC_O_B]